MPLDPYGVEIPANPGAKRVTQADGTTKPLRSNLALSGLTVTDDPTGNTTTIIASAQGTEAGQALSNAADVSAQRDILGGVEKIDIAPLTAATGYTKTWAAGRYSKVQIRLLVGSATSTAAILLTMTGLDATYRTIQMYQSSDAALAPSGFAIVATTSLTPGGTYANSSRTIELGMANGFYRQFKADEVIPDVGGGVRLVSTYQGWAADTTHACTGIAMTWGAAAVTGRIEVYGFLA